MATANPHVTAGNTLADDADVPSEMAVVDTFTKLIFNAYSDGIGSDYSTEQLAIVQALRDVDRNVALDSSREIGIYLRALGVREMIGLVSLVRQGYQAQRQPGLVPAGTESPASTDRL